jgi:hypothetical protein
MTTAFNTTPVLDTLGGALSLAVMAGLTFASAAIGAASPATPVPTQAAAMVTLPPVVMTVKRAPAVAQLPTVIVVAKRSAPATSA